LGFYLKTTDDYCVVVLMCHCRDNGEDRVEKEGRETKEKEKVVEEGDWMHVDIQFCYLTIGDENGYNHEDEEGPLETKQIVKTYETGQVETCLTLFLELSYLLRSQSSHSYPLILVFSLFLRTLSCLKKLNKNGL